MIDKIRNGEEDNLSFYTILMTLYVLSNKTL